MSDLPFLVNKLCLVNFRNFSEFSFAFNSKAILFVGKNGVGKTSVLEAISLLGNSGSIRGASLAEIVTKYKDFTQIKAFFLNHNFIFEVGISFESLKKKKFFTINGEQLNKNSKRQGDVRLHLPNVIYLTPQIELLLSQGKSSRRDYLDRIVNDIDELHQQRLVDYQKLTKERLLILQKNRHSFNQNVERWLDVIETQIIEIGIAIAAARIEAFEFFNKAIISFDSAFPKVKLKLSGEIESRILDSSSFIDVENFYKTRLKETRLLDLESGKTNCGTHRGDFGAAFLKNDFGVENFSTGEQKMIMISIVLARAKISSLYKKKSTIIILDEVVSHLDEVRKNNLLNEVLSLPVQSFFSATSQELLPEDFLCNSDVQLIQL